MTEASVESLVNSFVLTKEAKDLYKSGGVLAKIAKSLTDPAHASRQAVTVGIKEHPFDMRAVYDLQVANVHHARCLHAKVASTVGLGWDNDKVAEALDPLCASSWQETLQALCEDYWQVANAYLEVVRDGDKIVGLHHIPAPEVKIVIENTHYDRHYRHESAEGIGAGMFATFGDLEDFRSAGRAAGMSTLGLSTPADASKIAEIIHFPRVSSLSRWYGVSDWVAAVPSIELVQMTHQHNFDFFNNRGVPEFMLFVLGATVKKADWDKITNAMKSHIGLGNSFKSLALNIADPNATVQVEKLALENAGDATVFKDMNDTLALEIVSAHGVPPLLAGIQIPGKLGATNELPNALMAFQALVIGQAQHFFETKLAVTLGDRKLNGGLALRRKDFVGKSTKDPLTGQSKKKGGLRTVLDEINIGQADTIGRMRETVPEAKAKGRDLDAGLKD